MADIEGLETEANDDDTWYWTYQSPGGAFHRSPRSYASKAAASKAGRAWFKESGWAE
jgi:hypothetical protein